MEVKGITTEQVRQAVDSVNERYDGQLELRTNTVRVELPEPVERPWGLQTFTYERADIVELNKRGDRVRFTLKVKDVRNKPGAWVGMSGRRVNAACWHLNRDLYVEIFKLNPEARIKTALATYNGWQDFLASYPETGEANIGSYFQPLYMSEACNCHEYETYDADTILYRNVTDALNELVV